MLHEEVKGYHYQDRDYVIYVDSYKKSFGLFITIQAKGGQLIAQGVMPLESPRAKPWLLFEGLLKAANEADEPMAPGL